MLKKKRGRQHTTIQENAWNHIHEHLVDVLQKMVHYKTAKGYAKVAYGGYMAELKKSCKRILNVIDSYEEQEKIIKENQ